LNVKVLFCKGRSIVFMFVRRLEDCQQFIAGDCSLLREFFHPDKEQLNIGYSLAHAEVLPGETTCCHRIKQSSEVYYIIDGEGLMHINNQQFSVEKGCAIYIPEGANQYIKNVGKNILKFLCIVSPPWQADNEEVEKKEKGSS